MLTFTKTYKNGDFISMNWETIPYFIKGNIALYYNGKNYDAEKLYKQCESIVGDFCKTFHIQNKQLASPIKMYLTTTRNEWLVISEKYKDDLSNYCLEKQADNNLYASEFVSEIVRKLFLCEYVSKGLGSKEIANALSEYYVSKIYFGNDFNNKFKYWFIKNILNETLRRDTENNEDRDRELIIVYLIEMNLQNNLTLHDSNNLIWQFLDEAKNYYLHKFDLDSIPCDLSEIKSEEELLCYVCKNVAIGYKGADGNMYINSYKDFHKNMIIQSINNVLDNHIGTCIEQGFFLYKYFKSKKYNVKMFLIANYGNELSTIDSYKNLNAHIAIFVQKVDKWINIESANSLYHGIKVYTNISDALTDVSSNYYFHKHFEIYELNDIPIGANMVDFYNYSKKQKHIKFTGSTIGDFKVHYE